MASDKRTLYITSGSILILLIAALFIPELLTRWVLAAVLVPFAIFTALAIKKRSLLSVSKREATMVMVVIGIIYLMLYYLSGLYFGFANNYYKLSWTGFYKFIIPITLVIVSTEIIRYVLLAQKNKKVAVMVYFQCVLVEVLISLKLNNVDDFDVFMNLVGITLFPALVSNLFYHYLSKRFGYAPSMAFRLITVLYYYILPVLPRVPEYIMSLVGMVLPLLMYALIKTMYEPKKLAVSKDRQKVSWTFIAIAIVLISGWVMLISCQFKYGLLVIATESMTGEINKGDAVVFEQYDGQYIKEGQVIVFEKDKGTRVVHRVVEIKVIDGEVQYYTKGDANESRDSGYVKQSQIVGVTNFKIVYIGYPTLWLRSLFSN